MKKPRSWQDSYRSTMDPLGWPRQLIDDGLVRSYEDVLNYSHSSGDCAALVLELNRRDADELRRLRRAYSRGGGGRSKPDRDLRMALEFRQRGTTNISRTARIVSVGRRFKLRKSAAIEAINRGERLFEDALHMKVAGRTPAEIARELKVVLETAMRACNGS